MGGTVGVDPVSQVVDGDVVVIPAEGDEIVGVVAATVASLVDVVGQCSLTSRVSMSQAAWLKNIEGWSR